MVIRWTSLCANRRTGRSLHPTPLLTMRRAFLAPPRSNTVRIPPVVPSLRKDDRDLPAMRVAAESEIEGIRRHELQPDRRVHQQEPQPVRASESLGRIGITGAG